MIDDLKFAVKCGGSAKKIQLSSTTAVTIKPNPGKIDPASILDKKLSKSTGNLEQKECKKCREILHNELLDNITSQNSIVCKNDSRSNLSIRNPGLLIVEQEAALEAQTAFLNSQLNPHLHFSHQKNESKPKKHKSRKTKALLRVDSNDESSDYIQMNTFNKNSLIGSSRSKSSRLKPSISKNRDQYEIPIIRMNKNLVGNGNRHHSSTQNKDTSSTNLINSNNYQTSKNF